MVNLRDDRVFAVLRRSGAVPETDSCSSLGGGSPSQVEKRNSLSRAQLMSTRILIADDDASIRHLLRRLLEEHADWQVCDEAVNGHDAILKAAALVPDIVILDLAMPQMNGLQAAQEISARHPLVAMLLLTVQEVSPELVKQARKAGFRGAISKSTGTEVVEGVEALLRRRSFFELPLSDRRAG